MMDYENEKYIRVFTRDTPNWALMSWEANGLLLLILRKLDRAGVLDLGRHGLRGLAAILRVPLADIERLMPELLDGGDDAPLVMKGTVLFMPNFLVGQEASQSDQARQRASREKRRDVAAARERHIPIQSVTQSVDPSQDVTNGHTVSQPVTPARPARLARPAVESHVAAEAPVVEVVQPTGGESREVASADAETILRALRADRDLAPVATADFAEKLNARRIAGLKEVAWLVLAIGQAAADTSPGETEGSIRKRVRVYCDSATPSGQKHRPAGSAKRVVQADEDRGYEDPAEAM